MKRILKVLLTEQLVTGETLLTTIAEVEAILNSRPITSNSDSPSDAEPLTPNHLLLLQCNRALPPGVFKEDDQYMRRRWRQVQHMANVFWRRWIKEYLPTLQKRQKWNFPQPNGGQLRKIQLHEGLRCESNSRHTESSTALYFRSLTSRLLSTFVRNQSATLSANYFRRYMRGGVPFKWLPESAREKPLTKGQCSKC